MYKVVKLDLAPEIEVFDMMFQRCRSENEICTLIPGVKSSCTTGKSHVQGCKESFAYPISEDNEV